MADVSKLKLGSTTYNIKDANAARSDHTHSYLPLSGGTLTGAVTFANGTYNNVGDDAQLGDANQAGKIAIKGKNGATGIYFAPYSGSTAQSLTINGAGTATLTNNLAVGAAITAGTNITFGNATSGQIIAKTPSRTGAIITVGGSKKAAGDINGTALRIGAGGATLIGGGEYADNRYNVGDIADGDEKLFIGSDNGVYIETNGNTIADRKTFTFGTDGTFNSPSTIKQNGTAVSLSGHTHSFTPAGTIAVQTAGSTTSITPVSSKTVVTSASGATAAYASGNITFTNGSFGTGASVTTGTAVTVKTGDAAYKFTGTAGTTGA